MKTYPLIVDGQLITTGKMLEVRNPADESLVGTCPTADAALLDRAVAAARKALPAWSALPDAERVAKMNAIADLIEKHHAELAELVTREQGKTQSGMGANVEAGGAAAWTRVTASLSIPVETIQDDAAGKITIERRPVGVVGSITPWNWPMLIATWHVMPALRVGCTVVSKPASCTPLSTLRLYELMNSVLPPGVVNIVAGSGEIGDRMAKHPGINKIVFTGSTGTGKTVATGAIEHVQAHDAGAGRQRCRHRAARYEDRAAAGEAVLGLLHQRRPDLRGAQAPVRAREPVRRGGAEVRRLRVQDPGRQRHGSEVPHRPCDQRAQRDIVSSFVEDARKKGARIVTGGVMPKGPGYFYPLTVVADCTDDMLLVKEEQFGPAIPIIKYKTVDEAIARANALDVGLGGSVWGNDIAEATEIRRAARVRHDLGQPARRTASARLLRRASRPPASARSSTSTA